MPEVRACVKCGEPATHTFSPDPDIRGIPCCAAHVETVRTALLLMQLGEGGGDFMEILKGLDNIKKVKK